MPIQKVDPKVDFPALERDILAFWERTGAFDTLREINTGKPKWSFLDGPITANNPMGVHHAWGRTYKDIYQRYHAARVWGPGPNDWGHEQRYQNGFDCQGLWVEVEVEKEHGFESKRDIETFGIGKFVEECKARARKFAAIQTAQSKRLGYWMDWDNSYYTMSDENNYGIWAFLKKCYERGLVYKGFDVMPWCPRCGTGISQMEMNEGYREVPHTSVFVKFPIRGSKDDRLGSRSHKENVLVWTTTPWTLSSNVAAAVKPGMAYLKIKQGNEFFYVGKANFENARAHPVQTSDKSKLPGLHSIQAMFKNKGPFEIVGQVDGAALVDLMYEGPFDMLPGAAEAVSVHRVIAWDAVTESEGTGIVHIAPGCGAEDYQLGRQLGLPQIAPLFEDGSFRPEFGFLAGKRFDRVAEEVVNDLKSRGVLFAKEQYYHRYPHCWRCKDELVYRLVDEWFINMNWREEIMNSARQARWIPEWGLDRELDWLKNMGDWMISKKRYWGLALPIWECHQCGHFEVLGSREELEARAVAGWEEFEGHSPHKPWIDAVKIRCAQCGDENTSRIKDVGNPWLDASIVSLSTMGYFRDRAYWERWFPAEFVVEALPGQFRNWFYALLTVSTMMTGRSPFKVLKGHGLVLDDVGKPMHKSDGNAIWFEDAAERFGVDVMRWLYAETPPERNVLFGPKHCDEVRRDIILPWWNVYSFFANLARVDDFDPARHTASANERSLLDRWILSDLHRLLRAANDSYAAFDVERFCDAAKRFIDDLSTWYVRRSRRRFYGPEWSTDKRAAYSTLYEVITTLNRAMAPIVPFLSEAIYQNLVVSATTGSAKSVHHTPFPQADAARIDETLSARVAACIRLVSMGRSARKEANLKVRQPLAGMEVVPGSDLEREAVSLFGEHFEEELNVKRVALREGAEGTYTVAIEPNMKTVGPKFGRSASAAKELIPRLDGLAMQSAFDRGESFPVTIDGSTTLLTRDDVSVRFVFSDGFAGAVDGKTVVLLDAKITPELRNEGLARDLVRQINDLRKEADHDLGERLQIGWESTSIEIRGAIEQFRADISAETLSPMIREGLLPAPTGIREIELGGPEHRVTISIGRIEPGAVTRSTIQP